MRFLVTFFIVLVVLLLMATLLVHIKPEYFDSEPAPFPNSESVFSSLPPQSDKDWSWQYFAPFSKSCLGGNEKTGDCQHKMDFNCYINPHNMRYCFWR